MLKPIALLVIAFATSSPVCFAADRPVDMSKAPGFAAKVEALAASFDLHKQVSTFEKHKEARAALGLSRDADFRPGDCDDQGNSHSSCVDVACKRLGTFGCDEMSEIKTVGEACRGNHSGDCLDSSCKHLGTFGCDEMSEIRTIAASCRGVWSTGCVDVICQKLGTFGCDEMSELTKVGSICHGVNDASCIDSVCKRLGSFGCDELSEIEVVANSCK